MVEGIREKGGVLSNSSGSISKICWLASGNDELINRDKASLDIFWLRDESLKESDNLPDPTFSPGKSSRTSKPPLEKGASA